MQWPHTNYLASINHSSTYNGSDDELIIYQATSWFESGPVVLLVILYCIVVFGGVFGNASLVITLCTQTPTRFRNPLLVALCLADLMVTGVSAPLTVVALALANQTWSLTVTSCKTIYFMQVRFLIHFFQNLAISFQCMNHIKFLKYKPWETILYCQRKYVLQNIIGVWSL